MRVWISLRDLGCLAIALVTAALAVVTALVVLVVTHPIGALIVLDGAPLG